MMCGMMCGVVYVVMCCDRIFGVWCVVYGVVCGVVCGVWCLV